MKNRIYLILVTVLSLIFTGCAGYQNSVQTGQAEEKISAGEAEKASKKISDRSFDGKRGEDFKLRPVKMKIKAGKPYLPVGAEITSKDGKVPLSGVIKSMADLKGFTVSWANDVNIHQTVDVQITPEDNFWEALDNVLRQLDYFYELEEETLVIKYKETRRYHLVMPTLKENFQTSVGGSLIGGGAVQGRITGKTALEANIRKPFDFWAGVEANIKSILAGSQAGGGGKGYFVVDQNIGLITVNAPRKTHKQLGGYIDSLKKKIYMQVIIEAKIVEVVLNDASRKGINWENLLSRTLSANVSFGENNVVYPHHRQYTYDKLKFINNISLTTQGFNIMMDFLKTYGKTNVLSNPKMTLMNGHGASLTVGEDITYIDKVTSTTDENGNISYSVTTGSVLSGLGLAVMANIINDDEVILYIVPVTSELEPASSSEDIEYRVFGAAQVGLPRVRLRELATMAKVNNGETLIIGGHISKVNADSTRGFPFLGDLPGLGWLFKHNSKNTTTRELVIFIKTTIVHPFGK